MKAGVCTALGEPPQLTVMEWPSRPPGPGEIRVALHAGGVNFGDLLVTAGRYQVKLTPPFVLGTEGAGVVTACGVGVTRFKEGDRVLYFKWAGDAMETPSGDACVVLHESDILCKA